MSFGGSSFLFRIGNKCPRVVRSALIVTVIADVADWQRSFVPPGSGPSGHPAEPLVSYRTIDNSPGGTFLHW